MLLYLFVKNIIVR